MFSVNISDAKITTKIVDTFFDFLSPNEIEHTPAIITPLNNNVPSVEQPKDENKTNENDELKHENEMLKIENERLKKIVDKVLNYKEEKLEELLKTHAEEIKLLKDENKKLQEFNKEYFEMIMEFKNIKKQGNKYEKLL